LSSQSKSGAIDQLTLGDRPVDRDRRVGHPWYKSWSTKPVIHSKLFMWLLQSVMFS